MNNLRKTRAIVAIAPIAVLSAVLPVAGAQAEPPGNALVMSVYLDSVGADRVIAGDAATAITQIKKRTPTNDTDSLTADTNLCVAYTLSRQFEQAKARCDAAVIDARLTDADDVFHFGNRGRRLATAYSNRAVLNAVRDEKEKALADVDRARSLAPRLDFVSHNWTALNGGPDTVNGLKVASVRP
jgi:hypothetical protein